MLLLKRLFNRIQKINWSVIFLELFIVFIGVYLAFLFSTFREKEYTEQEADKILTALKIDLENIRYQFPGRAVYQRDLNTEWDSVWNAGSNIDFYNWKYIQPQYDFTTIEYALKTDQNTIVDFTLYEKLTSIYQIILQLTEVETRITDLGFQYRNIPQSLPKDSEAYLLRKADNRLLFYKFRWLGRSRGRNLDLIAQKAQEALVVINEKLGPKKQIALEYDILKLALSILDPDKEFTIDMVKKEVEQLFPLLENDEVNVILTNYYQTPTNDK